MVTLRGSSTAMARGACSFSTSRTHASSRCGSIVAWATVTPTCGTRDMACRHPGGWGRWLPPAPPCPTAPTRAQKLLMASGGKPRRRRAVRVKSRGSSQSLRTHRDHHQTHPERVPPHLLAPILPHSTRLHQADDFPLGDDGVEQVQAPVLPLHGAVDVQRVAQPEVGGAPAGNNLAQHHPAHSPPCQQGSTPGPCTLLTWPGTPWCRGSA